jgi:hypothetical protein
VDVVGAPVNFNISGINVTQTGDEVTFEMFTNFNHDGWYSLSGLTVYAADFGLDLDQDGIYEYGIVLKDHDQWTESTAPFLTDLDVGLYSVNEWETSFDFIDPVAGFIYGGKWDDEATAGSNPRDPIVAIKDYGEKVADLVSALAITDITGNGPNHKWSFTIDVSSLTGWGGGDDIFWGGATCANDSIQGSIPDASALVLLGSAMIGVGIFGRKKLFKKEA